jgi:alpha-amylase
MAAVCFYFQVHQPFRIKKYRFFDIGKDHDYFSSPSDDQNNQKILQKVAHKCYLPTNNLLLKLLDEYPEFKISFSLSGVFLEQIEHDFPEVLDSFKKLVETGQCEILEETYYHSLAFLYSKSEFKAQVQKHNQIVQRLFGVSPKVFRNTELIYNNEVAQEVEKMGYKGIITEGADRVLEWKSPNFLYRPKGTKKIKLLLKNYQLSDDIAFRFSNQAWQDFPLTADKFSNWVNQINGNGEVVNLFMDYETFGEHQWAETGIFEFLKDLPAKILANPDNTFVTPSEAIARFETVGEMDIPEYISWADSERDLSAWRSNEMQVDALQTLYKLETEIKDSGDFELLEDWRKLQTSDHFYYMCTKFWSDGDVHKYFSPYQSPYEAFIYFMNAFHDLQARLKVVQKVGENIEKNKKPYLL